MYFVVVVVVVVDDDLFTYRHESKLEITSPWDLNSRREQFIVLWFLL